MQVHVCRERPGVADYQRTSYGRVGVVGTDRFARNGVRDHQSGR